MNYRADFLPKLRGVRTQNENCGFGKTLPGIDNKSRDISLDVSLGVRILPVIEEFSLENRPRVLSVLGIPLCAVSSVPSIAVKYVVCYLVTRVIRTVPVAFTLSLCALRNECVCPRAPNGGRFDREGYQGCQHGLLKPAQMS